MYQKRLVCPLEAQMFVMYYSCWEPNLGPLSYYVLCAAPTIYVLVVPLSIPVALKFIISSIFAVTCNVVCTSFINHVFYFWSVRVSLEVLLSESLRLLSVYVYAPACSGECVCVESRSDVACLPQRLSTLFLRQDLSLNPVFPRVAGLAGSQPQDSFSAFPSAGITGALNSSPYA